MPELVARIDTDVSPSRLWDVVTDWPNQGRWIPLTRAWAVGGEPVGTGSVIHAWTGVGKLGFLDEMVVDRWVPPQDLELRHVGKVVRGTAGFFIEPLGSRGSRITWWERIDVPFGRVGLLGWKLAGPVAKVLLVFSLRKLAAVASAGGR